MEFVEACVNNGVIEESMGADVICARAVSSESLHCRLFDLGEMPAYSSAPSACGTIRFVSVRARAQGFPTRVIDLCG